MMWLGITLGVPLLVGVARVMDDRASPGELTFSTRSMSGSRARSRSRAALWGREPGRRRAVAI